MFTRGSTTRKRPHRQLRTALARLAVAALGGAALVGVASSPASAAPAVSTVEEVRNWYQNGLGREPDSAGWGYWVDVIRPNCNLRLADAAYGVLNSPEFHARNPTNSDKVRALYSALLDRAPDPAGHLYWTGQLNAGRVTFQGLFWNFYNSAEGSSRRATVCTTLIQRQIGQEGFLWPPPYSHQAVPYWFNSEGNIAYNIVEGYDPVQRADYVIANSSVTSQETNLSAASAETYGYGITTSSNSYSGCQRLGNWYCDYLVWKSGIKDVSHGINYWTYAKNWAWNSTVPALACAGGIRGVKQKDISIVLLKDFKEDCAPWTPSEGSYG